MFLLPGGRMTVGISLSGSATVTTDQDAQGSTLLMGNGYLSAKNKDTGTQPLKS